MKKIYALLILSTFLVTAHASSASSDVAGRVVTNKVKIAAKQMVNRTKQKIAESKQAVNRTKKVIAARALSNRNTKRVIADNIG